MKQLTLNTEVDKTTGRTTLAATYNDGDIRARYNISKNTDGKWIIATRDTLMTTRPSTLGTPRGLMAEDLYDTADQALSAAEQMLDNKLQRFRNDQQENEAIAKELQEIVNKYTDKT